MKNNPLVSVVTPSFNQVGFIEETLRSVELQYYRPIHQIVIDGGSTDGTVELLKRWAGSDHGEGYTFEWISERDRGHADALNKGFDRVQGDVVGWLNSDDLYFDRYVVSAAVKALKAHPEVDVVHGEVALISESSGLHMVWCMPQFIYERALRGWIIPQPSVFFRRLVTDRHRLDPSLRVAIDQIYWLQIGKEHKFLKIQRIQAADRDQPGRISRTSTETLMKVSRDAYLQYGAKEKPTPAEALSDTIVRGVLRIRGLLYVLVLLMRGERNKSLAFPMWFDSPWKSIKRQLTMRVNKRPDMGKRPIQAERESHVAN
jgi:glycosyltransferase involved in cell wall biosynthesis